MHCLSCPWLEMGPISASLVSRGAGQRELGVACSRKRKGAARVCVTVPKADARPPTALPLSQLFHYAPFRVNTAHHRQWERRSNARFHTNSPSLAQTCFHRERRRTFACACAADIVSLNTPPDQAMDIAAAP